MFGYQLAEMFYDPEVVFIHDHFPFLSTAFTLFHYRSFAVFKSRLRFLHCSSLAGRNLMNNKITGLVMATVILAFAHLADAQQPKKIPRIGYLSADGSPSNPSALMEGFRKGLR